MVAQERIIHTTQGRSSIKLTAEVERIVARSAAVSLRSSVKQSSIVGFEFGVCSDELPRSRRSHHRR